MSTVMRTVEREGGGLGLKLYMGENLPPPDVVEKLPGVPFAFNAEGFARVTGTVEGARLGEDEEGEYLEVDLPPGYELESLLG